MITALRHDAAPVMRSWANSHKPAWMLWLRLLFMTPGFQLVIMLRIQRALRRLPLIGLFVRRGLWHWTTLRFNCDIDPNAIIHPGLYLPHPVGIVIGGGVVIGRNVTILQNVTIGRVQMDVHSSPVIGDNVKISCGACILGLVTIGNGAIVGANSVVIKDVPAGTNAVGSPARIVERKVSAEGEV